MTPEQRAAYNERAELSEEFDVPYTYGALTGDRSFMANREAIMRALPGSADPMTDFLVGQQGAVQRAGIRTATDIAPITPYEGYLRAADAARDTITSMVERRQRTARKMYADIWATKPTMSAQGFVDELERASVNEEAGLKAIYERAIRDVKKNTAEDGSIPVETLHNIQSRYNANAAEATNSQKKRVNTVVGQSIKGVLDERVPGYTAVSNFYRDASQQIDRIREATKIGKIEKVNRVDVANKVKNWFTGPDVYPEEIRNIKQIWREELDPLKYTEAMKGLQSAFLRNAIERIDITQSGESIPNIAGKIAQALGGDPLMPGGIRKAQIVDELYTPAQRQKLNRLLRVLQDTSQILSIKSPTQPRLVAEEMQRTASEDVLRELGQVATEAATSGGMNVLDWVLRSPGRLKRVITRERQKEMQANELYAHALNEGTTATIQHFEKLERAVRRARELPGDAAQNELMTALGTFFGATVPQVNTPSAL